MVADWMDCRLRRGKKRRLRGGRDGSHDGWWCGLEWEDRGV